MQPEITRKIKWVELESPYETWFVPQDDYNPAFWGEPGGTIKEAGIVEGYGARLSAPGYMDCTEWGVFDTPEAAREHLIEMYCECCGDEPCELCQILNVEGG